MTSSEQVPEAVTVPLGVSPPPPSLPTPPPSPPTPPPPLEPHPRLERLTRDRVLGGVAAGLAEHLGLPARTVRIALAALAVAGGSGLVLYAVFWIVLPLRPESPGEPPPRASGRSRGEALLLLAALPAGGALLSLADSGLGGLVLPLLLVAAGVALVWRQADEAQRARWRVATGVGRRRQLASVLGGALLLAAGLAGFLAWRGELAEAREGLLATAVVLFGLTLLAAPFLSRVLADLRDERAERIRSQERAEIAARLHDSVLQTLALIQRSADDPREVARLARSQERELRGWLYRPARPATAASLAPCLETVMAEVEEAHGVPVEVVVVGDVPLDDRLQALVAAAREAAWNAAKHSGAARVQVYAEVEPGAVTVFVRDRGRGFDPASVPGDRYGVRESIEARMARVGGRAVVRSAPGSGTEVRLEVSSG